VQRAGHGVQQAAHDRDEPSKREGLGRAVTGEQLLVAPHAVGDLRPADRLLSAHAAQSQLFADGLGVALLASYTRLLAYPFLRIPVVVCRGLRPGLD
jgi:hypothetical protein